METRYLRTLLAVVDSGSFSRSAIDLNISQSAVSQRVRFMEEHYGISLLDRSGAVIIATEAGRAIARKARQILALEIELEDEVKGFTKKDSLSICCTPTFGIVYLPSVLSRFFRVKSEEVKLYSSLNTPQKSLKGLLANEFDVIVIEHCLQLELSNVIAKSLPPDELAIISAPSLRLSRKNIPLTELMEQRLIARRDGCSSRCLLEENLARFGKSLNDFRSVVVHDDLSLAIQTTIEGQGVSFLSRHLVMEHLENGTLIEHTVEGFTYLRSRTIILNRSRSENQNVKEFAECVRHVFGL